MRNFFPIFLVFIFLISACKDKNNNLKPQSNTKQTLNKTFESEIKSDTLQTQKEKNKISIYIDSLSNKNVLTDTNRLNEIGAWVQIAKSPKTIENGLPIVRYNFPVKQYQKQLSNPKTYFFAKWDSVNSTFKNGQDFLVLTWETNNQTSTDDTLIFKSLIQYWGKNNFPCFCFKSGNTIYSTIIRQSVAHIYLLNETKRLRNIINPSSTIYGYRNCREIN